MKRIFIFFELLRPHQWAKNLCIFLPLFFNLKINDITLLTTCFITFLGFSLVASSIYVFNDFFDIDIDQAHPVKKNRPLASGKISKPQAIAAMIILLTSGLAIFSFLGTAAMILILFYVVQNLAYCIKLKHYPVIDVVIISLGFVLRVLIGGAVTNVYLSNWIILMSFLLALFLALAKRRDDVLIFMTDEKFTRRNIYGYNLEFLNSAFTIMASVVIVAYIMYTVESSTIAFANNRLFLSSFFVIIGMLRYLQVTMVYNRSGSPTVVLMKDRFLQAIIIGWLLTLFILLYIKPEF